VSRTGTSTDEDDSTDSNVSTRYPTKTGHVLYCSVAPTSSSPGSLDKLHTAIQRLISDGHSKIILQSPNPEFSVTGTSHEHTEKNVKSLEQQSGGTISAGQTRPVFLEAVCYDEHEQVHSASLPNKQIRANVKTKPLASDLVRYMTSNPNFEAKMGEASTREQTLRSNFDWTDVDARRVYALGPNGYGPNFLLNVTGSAQDFEPIKTSSP
jgi:hypothetical protein